MTTEIERRQQTEIDYWKESVTERPESNSIENIINKVEDAAVFLDCIKPYRSVFERSRSIVELGAGQCWASCIVKRLFPQAFVTATDISEYAVASAYKWEYIYQTKLDNVRHCRAYEIGEPDSSVDCIFCFAAAHHFVAHRRVLAEVHRVLRSGGHCFYFYEPSCRQYIHAMARRRVKKKRPEVPEDVLVYKKVQEIAAEVGLNCQLHFYPSTIKRGQREMVYYLLLQRVRLLQRLLPCTINYHFSKA